MQLEIIDRKELLSRKFCLWLIDKIHDKIILDLDESKLDVWNEYLNSNKSPFEKLTKTVDIKPIIVQGACNLTFEDRVGKYQIAINNNQYAINMNRVRLDTICKLVNFGDSSVKGYPIFTNTFEYFSNNLYSYVDRYLHGQI